MSLLYNKKHLLLATVLGGTHLSASVLGLNLWAMQRKSLATITIALGFVFEIILSFVVYLLVFNLLSFSSNTINRQVSLLILFIAHSAFAVLLYLFITKKKKIPERILPDDNSNIQILNTIVLVVISILGFFTLIAIPPLYLPLFFVFVLTHIYGIHSSTKVFKSGVLKKRIKVILISLACLFPAAFTIHWVVYQFASSRLIVFDYVFTGLVIYCVFLLYVLIFLLGVKLLNLALSYVKIIPSNVITNSKFRSVIFALCIFGPLTITLYGGFVNNSPRVSKYDIVLPKKASELTHLKIVCVADIHLKNTTSSQFIKKLTSKIAAIKPDVILIPGDVAESYRSINKGKKDLFQASFAKINPRFGIYVSPGNHDGNKSNCFYKDMNMILLNDSLITIENNFQLLGLKYRGNNETRPLDTLINASIDLPLILLDHAPYCLDKAIEHKVDIQFSGHTHNGQIWPFNYITSGLFELDWGYKKIEDTHLFVTSGVQDGLLPLRQNASIPIRTGSFSEIIQVDISFD